MSQSLLDSHLRSAISIQKELTKSKSTAANQPVKSKKNKEKNFLDEARVTLQTKRHKVTNILKTLADGGEVKKFSKRRLNSIIKVQRYRK
jgi:ElaB/YqjD/DUF883 family membrane-anchored ribosome-binding protein